MLFVYILEDVKHDELIAAFNEIELAKRKAFKLSKYGLSKKAVITWHEEDDYGFIGECSDGSEFIYSIRKVRLIQDPK